MAKFRDPKVRISSAYASEKRTLRTPQHPFQLKTRPFQIQPFLLAPVLPGETMKNLMMQSRVVSDPLKHPLIGWWTEYFVFYVKHQDIAHHMGTNFHERIMLDPTFDPASMATAPSALTGYNGGINYVQSCLETVTEYYFRDHGEDWDVATLDGLPLSQITGKAWTDSMTLLSEMREDRDVNVDLDGDGNIMVSEMLQAQQHWQALRDAGLENMDYEDFIRTFGVQVPEVQNVSDALYKPELIRYSRQWTYPTNTIDPVSGAPSSAVSWAVAFRADKDRYFKEPGFIFGITVARPKVYVKEQKGLLANYLTSAFSWLPAMAHRDYEKSFIEFDKVKGPVAGAIGENYVVDARDLFLYGEQFSNYEMGDDDGALPVIKADGSKRYVTGAAVDNLFKTAEKNKVKQDGIVSLSILGRQVDRTPGPTL